MGFALLIPVVIFFGLSIVFSKGQGTSFISGYNTLSAAERAQYDEQKLCKFMSKIMCLFGVGLLLMAIGDFVQSPPIFFIGLSGMVGTLLFSIFFSGKKKRFLKQS